MQKQIQEDHNTFDKSCSTDWRKSILTQDSIENRFNVANYDIFGKSMGFTWLNSSTYKTKMGFFLTLCFYAFIALVAYDYILGFLHPENSVTFLTKELKEGIKDPYNLLQETYPTLLISMKQSNKGSHQRFYQPLTSLQLKCNFEIFFEKHNTNPYSSSSVSGYNKDVDSEDNKVYLKNNCVD